MGPSEEFFGLTILGPFGVSKIGFLKGLKKALKDRRTESLYEASFGRPWGGWLLGLIFRPVLEAFWGLIFGLFFDPFWGPFQGPFFEGFEGLKKALFGVPFM